MVKDILGQGVGEEEMEARLESKEEKLSLRQFLYNQQDEEDENEEEEEEAEACETDRLLMMKIKGTFIF